MASAETRLGGTRLIIGYAVVAAFLLVAVAVSVWTGRDERAQPAISQPVGRLQPPVQRVKSSVVRTARTAGLKDCGEAADLV